MSSKTQDSHSIDGDVYDFMQDSNSMLSSPLKDPIDTGDHSLPADSNSTEPTQEQIQEWKEQLTRTEEEIYTLRQVLTSKLRFAQELKRNIGITPITEMKQDFKHSLQSIKDSNTFRTTSEYASKAKDKTQNTLISAGSRVSAKWDAFKNSNRIRSIEGKVGTAYTSLKNSASYGSSLSKLSKLNSGTPNSNAPNSAESNQTDEHRVDDATDTIKSENVVNSTTANANPSTSSDA